MTITSYLTTMPITLHLPTVLAKLADGTRDRCRTARPSARSSPTSRRGFPTLAPRLRDEAGNPYPFVTFYLNDEDIRFHGGFDATVADGDELTVVPAIAGG